MFLVPFQKKGLENRSSRFEPKNSWLSFSRGSGPPLTLVLSSTPKGHLAWWEWVRETFQRGSGRPWRSPGLRYPEPTPFEPSGKSEEKFNKKKKITTRAFRTSDLHIQGWPGAACLTSWRSRARCSTRAWQTTMVWICSVLPAPVLPLRLRDPVPIFLRPSAPR